MSMNSIDPRGTMMSSIVTLSRSKMLSRMSRCCFGAAGFQNQQADFLGRQGGRFASSAVGRRRYTRNSPATNMLTKDMIGSQAVRIGLRT